MTDRPVLFASYAGVLGGAERMLLDVTTRLDIPLTIACPEGALADAVRRAGLQHSALKPRPLRSRPHHLFGLAYELAKHRGTLVAWGARTVLAASMLPRPRFVAVHHDLYPRPAIRGAVRAATRRASITVATSRTIAAQLPNATVIHPGVDLAAYQPTPLPDGPPHAVVIGALVGWKRPDLALEIAKRVPDMRVLFAGEPLPGESFDTTPRENVTFAGRVPDVRDALANAHVLLHCADQEPFGMVLIEALAAGRPVVAPNAAGPSEIITGPEGRLYPPGNADAAAEALRAVLAEPHAPEAARARAEAFDIDDTVRRFRALL